MDKEKEMPMGYGLLWIIVIIIAIMVGISHFGYLVGQGRWECNEWETYKVRKCNLNVVNVYGNYPCSISYEEVCVNEVWTRKLKK